MKKYKVISLSEYEDYIKLKSMKDSGLTDQSLTLIEDNSDKNNVPILPQPIKTKPEPQTIPQIPSQPDVDSFWVILIQ